jgi:LmbE family N-acetylglucosaminyl deacetylase
MSEQLRVFAIGAHPDDIEFNMAGTLYLLAQAGFEAHMMNVSRSNLDSNELSQPEIVTMRLREAENAARVIDAVYHPPFASDLLILYNEQLLRQMLAVIREVRPSIVLLPSLNDYMEDHTNTARLVVTACFSRAMAHFISAPPHAATDQDVFLYHAQPHLNRDGMRSFVVPSQLVNISEVMETKLKMLACHESQRQWLGDTQGLDDYLDSMCKSGAELAGLLDQDQWRYAEGWRQHSHVGFSQQDQDLLTEVLGNQVRRLEPPGLG